MKTIPTLTLAVASVLATSAIAQVGTPGSRAGGRVGTIPPVSTETPASQPSGTKPAGPAVASGKVKPPGSPLGEVDPKQAALDKRQRDLDRRIRTGICRGC